jgi:hypothetical protein
VCADNTFFHFRCNPVMLSRLVLDRVRRLESRTRPRPLSLSAAEKRGELTVHAHAHA